MKYRVTGEVREPKKGEWFIHSSTGKVTKCVEPSRRLFVPFFGCKRVIVEPEGYYEVRMTEEQKNKLTSHYDAAMMNIGRTAKWVSY